MSASPPASRKRSPAAPHRPRRWLRWLGLVLLGLLLIVLAAALWVWTQRYSLIERQAIVYLKSQGIEADLDIRSATRTRADIRNIELAYDGERFLSVGQLVADYQWRDLLEGRVERLAFDDLEATVTLDAQGRIIDGWRPPSSGGQTAFPLHGVTVERARIRVITPFGELPVSGDASLSSLNDFTVSGDLGDTVLRRDSFSARLSGPFDLSRKPEQAITITAPETALTLDHPQGRLSETRADLSVRIAPDGGPVSGDAVFTGGTFLASAGIAGQVDTISIQGRYADGFGGTLTPVLTDVRLTEETRRRDLAATLSLANALSEVPVAQNFAPGLVSPLERLLGGSDIKGEFRIDLRGDMRTLQLLTPLEMEVGPVRAVLMPDGEVPFYSYASGSGQYAVRTRASLSSPLPMTLSPLAVDIRSSNGLSVDGLAGARGRLSTSRVWNARTQDGRAASLQPLSVGFDYVSPIDAPARLTLRGAADYIGDVPGGYVEGLDTSGTLTAVLREGRPQADFSPNAPLAFDRLETTSDWRVEDFTGTLDPVSPLYRRTGADRAAIQTRLRDARFRAVRPEAVEGGAASLDVQVGQAAMNGAISERMQDWTVEFAALAMQSETFPVEGTDLAVPSGTFTARLSETDRTQFTLFAPDSTLDTPAYAVRGMALDANGTAEDYTLAFEGGRVRMKTGTIPILPAAGTLRFADGVFTGEATTTLPKAPDQPIAIDYALRDGEGTADVAIRNLRFRPGRLQPQDLAPALRGKIAQVDGAIDADLDIRFGGDDPPSGTGTVQIYSMDLGTAPGPITGLSGAVELTSLFPVVTAPSQRLTLDRFDPGFPLENGEVLYGLVADGVAIEQAVWPLGEGQVAFDPFTWLYGAEENRVVLRVSGVEVGEFLKDIGDGRITASGTLEGEIPVVVRGLDVSVARGRLEVAQGGTINYRPKAGENLSDRIPNEYAGQAFKALENFDYDSLFAEIDGPLDGEIKLGIAFTGSNEDVLYNVPFAFDITVEGELFNIARSLNPNGLSDRVVSQVQARRAADE